MEVGHQDPGHLPIEAAPDRGGPTLPGLVCQRVVVARVHERPAIVALHEIHRHEPQRQGYRQLQSVDVLGDPRRLPDGLRA